MAADALYREEVGVFHSVYPQAKEEPTEVPMVLDVLVVSKPEAWQQ